MDQDQLKRAAAKAAIDYVVSGEIVGVGSGSTVNFFIDELGAIRDRIAGAVSSSERSSDRLRANGIEVLDLNAVIGAGRRIPVYVDGADEINPKLQMIKGGGGALTREKIVAAASEQFVCIVDASKLSSSSAGFRCRSRWCRWPASWLPPDCVRSAVNQRSEPASSPTTAI